MKDRVHCIDLYNCVCVSSVSSVLKFGFIPATIGADKIKKGEKVSHNK